MRFSDRLFYFIQSCLINWELVIFEHLRPFVYRSFFKKMGKRVRISPGSHFKYPSEISIGNDVYIGRNCIFVGKGGLIIGNDVLIGAGSKICTTSHVYKDRKIPINKQGIISKPISIGDNVWIGFDCKILGGVCIKAHSILATNSVLLEDQFYEENSVIAGVPAVKKGVTNS